MSNAEAVLYTVSIDKTHSLCVLSMAVSKVLFVMGWVIVDFVKLNDCTVGFCKTPGTHDEYVGW